MLKGNQKKLDKNKDGKISGEDFKLLRKKPGGAIAGALALGAIGALGASKLMKKNKISSLVSPVKMLDDQSKDSKTQKKTDQQKASKGKMIKARVGRSIERKKSNLVKKTPIKDFVKNTLEGKYMDKNRGTAEPREVVGNRRVKKRNMGGEMRGYGAARTSGMGLQDEQLVPGKSLDYYKDLM